jgi:lysophospholipase L1-like esterase
MANPPAAPAPAAGGHGEARPARTPSRRAVAIAVSALAVAAAIPLASRAWSAPPTRTVLYLDLGASVSRGVQPTAVDPFGQPTTRGYANRLVTLEAAKGVRLRLTQLGCPGESLASMIHGPDPCYLAPDTQLSDAVAFLKAHRAATTLVSVDLGFNTLDVCFHHLDIDLTCVNPQLTTMRSQLATVMSTLARSAGPHVAFLGLGHYNPYLTRAGAEGKTEAFAHNSVVAMARMNRALTAVYGSFHARFVDVADAFHEPDTTVIQRPGHEAIAVNVSYECRLTWMCAKAPYGPNIHPTDVGYAAIAAAMEHVVPAGY